MSVWAAASAIAAALRDDPFYAALLAQPARSAIAGLPTNSQERHGVLTRYFIYAIDEAATWGRLTLAEPPGYGAAIWLLPERASVRVEREAAKQQALRAILGPEGFASYMAMVAAMETLTAPVVPDSAWYLSILGVAPEHQGRGIGKLLLRPTLEEADAQRAVCYLETFGEHTLGFYQRLGFTPVGSFVEPLTGAPYWVLCRRPLEAAAAAAQSGKR